MAQLSHSSACRMQAASFGTTAERQRGSISLDGHSETSAYWKGGAAYIRMCPRCGLEPSSDGKLSNCMCMCLNALCCKPLHGHKRCAQCGVGSGSPEPPKVVTVHIKAKRARVVHWWTSGTRTLVGLATFLVLLLLLCRFTHRLQSTSVLVTLGTCLVHLLLLRRRFTHCFGNSSDEC
jgi:hypothetical protein